MTFSEPIRARRGGSRDGAGAGDHDEPHTFGHRPTMAAPFPFSTRELARLLALRSQLAWAAGIPVLLPVPATLSPLVLSNARTPQVGEARGRPSTAGCLKAQCDAYGGMAVNVKATTVRLFTSHAQARDAIRALTQAGIKPQAISVIARSPVEVHTVREETAVAKDLEADVMRGVFSEVVDVLGSVESLLVPGFARYGVLITGDLASHIKTVVEDNRAGGAIAASLVGLGVPADRAAAMERAFREGEILVVVHGADDTRAARADGTMRLGICCPCSEHFPRRRQARVYAGSAACASTSSPTSSDGPRFCN